MDFFTVMELILYLVVIMTVAKELKGVDPDMPSSNHCFVSAIWSVASSSMTWNFSRS